jgi:hypothetical protein
MSNKFSKIIDKAKDVAKSADDYLESSGVKSKVEKGLSETKQFLDDKGITDTAQKAKVSVSDHMDGISGAKILQLVEERLEIQNKYNDILATKLDEALKRISQLESKIENH